MRRISTGLVLAFVAACVLSVGGAAPGAMAAKPKVKNIQHGQRQILAASAVKVKVKSKKAGKVKVKAYSKTFDDPNFKKLTRADRVRFKRPGTRVAKLKLTAKGRDRVSECGALKMQVRTGKGKHGETAELKRNTPDCKPKPIDLSRAADCDFIGSPDGRCLMPFPDDYYTVRADTATGRQVAFRTASMGGR